MRENPRRFVYSLRDVRVVYLLYVHKYLSIHLHIHTYSNPKNNVRLYTSTFIISMTVYEQKFPATIAN